MGESNPNFLLFSFVYVLEHVLLITPVRVCFFNFNFFFYKSAGEISCGLFFCSLGFIDLQKSQRRKV